MMFPVMIALLLGAGLTIPAFAAPGDPRLVQGTLEWPATLTREPLVIVRGDDGHVYYCDVTDSARHKTERLRAGDRVALLGIESARPHEVAVIVIGTGDAAALARALSQGLADRPPFASTPPPAAAPAPSAAPAAVVAPAPPGTAPAPAAAPPAPAPAVVPATVTTAPAAATAAAPPTAATASPPAATTPPPAATTPPPAATTPPPAATTPPPAATTPPPARRTIASPAAARGDSRGQWIRLDGLVESVRGTTLVLKADDGAVAYVDISQLSPNAGQVLRPGSPVTVYGHPLEHRFEAAGYIQTSSPAPEPPAPAQPGR